ncbi:MAG: diaminopimelate decarboxylase [Betaproteobacteria bacterium RBG_16_64_18]|nr:MAG: diaminopimelate decarboxylase [Betaproteobacteria bacterium RBG_16_64_18]OGA12856.1 MAG: diaminopimelate decarboxylase [Betaproteobacteria bacterium RIFCSPLOWO2_02_FULL_65_20]OGA37790.1 MAG: diaminopimelate decarboxylase [Betaproteobacteria bacterium RIFCSPLOWO2_12_FULL_65_110]
MNPLSLSNGALSMEAVPLETVAQQFGTPCYVYSRAALESAWNDFATGCAGRDVLVCYAVKANSNLAILNLFSRLGAGFDIVSGGELARVIAAGGSASKTVFSGVGKTEDEMRTALAAGILCFNVESQAEIERLDRVARGMGLKAPVSLRVNPDVDPKTHPYIATGLRDNKFGITYDEALALYRKAAMLPGVRIVGMDVHIGSQITEMEPFISALEKVLQFVDTLDAGGIRLEHLDMGGGLGIRYRDEEPPAIRDYLARLFALLGERRIKLLFEPGRAMVGNAGVLLTRVEYLKHGQARNFAIVDAAMNDLMRPVLYEAWHDIVPVRPRNGAPVTYDVVGPVCESGDFLGLGRSLAVQAGDLLAILSAGAYGMSMSSNYNTRPRAAEVIVDGADAHLARAREPVESLFALERILP